MIINLYSAKYFSKKYLMLLSIFALQLFSAQTVPTNSRLFQINTLKGSALTILESTESHIYHVGTANSEIGFDGYNYSNVGLDDLFILKSNSADGSNVWLKTFNAGVKGNIYPKKVYIDANDNVYIYGEFSGSIALGSRTITSSSSANTFLLKLDAAGNVVWINSFANTDAKFSFSIKMASNAVDLFMIYSQNHLVRINDLTGAVIYDKVYSPEVDLRGIALKNNTIYVAGFTLNPTEVFGTETVTGNNGFILKGDLDANFSASVKTVSTSAFGADISDVAIDSAGQVLLTGYSNSSTNLESETGVVTYTYNPKTPIETDKLYYYTAKIDADLKTISFFRNSSPINRYAINAIRSVDYSSKLIPYGNAGAFRVLNKVKGFGTIKDFTNPNGTITIVNSNFTSDLNYFLISSNDFGASTFATYSSLKGTLLVPSMSSYIITTINSRLFKTESRNISNSSLMWTKQKTSSLGGSLSKGFISHLNSEKEDTFVSTVLEGKGNFFGLQINNNTGNKSQHIARLGVNGLPKWTARFSLVAGTPELNLSNDFAVVDKDDHLIFLANTIGSSSTFYDANGQTVSFQQAELGKTKVIIKLDKNGNLKWSNKILNSNSLRSAITTDNSGDIYIIGDQNSSIATIEGYNLGTGIGNSSFLVKLNGATGTVIYAKVFPNFEFYNMHPAFNSLNELYLFTEPLNDDADYMLDGITIPTAPQGNLLMLKVNNAGNVIWGKNFYTNNTSGNAGFADDVSFDGENFIMSGNLSADYGQNYTGLDLSTIANPYADIDFTPFIAKISSDGTVIWQKAIHNSIFSYSKSNVDLDSEKNIYIYKYVNGKLNFDGVEYSFDATAGNKIVQKFDTNGILKYNLTVDRNPSDHQFIDVIDDDIFNLLGATSENNLLNYPVNNNNSSNLYIATFGKLNKNYLTPEKNYLELNTLEIPNNPVSTDNQFSFDLINNVNWTAVSDQPWLNLSFTSLVGKNPLNTINGNGDAKITLTANANTTGVVRTSSITITGEEVAGKTIIVTQGAILATGESKITVITLYPNPTSDYLNIKSDQKISKVEIFDMTGKRVKSSKLQNNQIEVSTLIKGNYIIKISTEKGVVTSKFIKK